MGCETRRTKTKHVNRKCILYLIMYLRQMKNKNVRDQDNESENNNINNFNNFIHNLYVNQKIIRNLVQIFMKLFFLGKEGEKKNDGKET